MKLLTWIVLLPVAALIIVFAVVNRGMTTLNLWPLPYEIDLPLFSVIFGGTLVGVVWGGVAAWSAAGATRLKARQKTRQSQELAAENRRLKEQIAEFEKQERERNREAARAVIGDDAGNDETKALPNNPAA